MAIKTRSRILRTRGLFAGSLPRIGGALAGDITLQTRQAVLAGALPRMAGGIAGSAAGPAATTLEQDWIARANAAGVIWATDFRTANEVNLWRHVEGTGLVVNPTPGSIGEALRWAGEGRKIGQKCLEFEHLPSQMNNTQWIRNLENVSTQRQTTIQAGGLYGPGSVIYLQFQYKWSWLRYRTARAAPAFKVVYLSSCQIGGSNTAQECLLFESFNSGIVQVSGSTATQNSIENRWEYTDPLNNGAYWMQPGSTYGGQPGAGAYCQYPASPAQSACWPFEPDMWVTYLMRVKCGDPGVFNTEVTVWAAREHESTYSKIYDRPNLRIPYFEAGNGYSAVIFTTYENGYSSGPAKNRVWFDEAILSTQPIACPMPRYTVPSWFASAANSTWGTIPGTGTGTIRAAHATLGTGADCSTIVTAWNSPAWDQDKKQIIFVGAGGHGDYSGNEAYVCPLTGATNGWARLNTPAPSDASDSLNTTGQRSDGSMTATHTYGNIVYAAGKVWFPGLASVSGSTGWPTTACWNWDQNALSNGRRGYTYLGKACTTMSGPYQPSMYDGWCAYDPVDRNVWLVAMEANGGATAPGLWKVSVDTGAITQYPIASGSLVYGWLVCIPEKRILLARGESGFRNNLIRLDLENPNAGWVNCVESGTPRGQRGDAAVYHPQAGTHGKVYVMGGTNLSTVRTLTVPSALTGTWAWGSATLLGTAPASPQSGSGGSGSFFKKLGLIENFGGRSMLALVNSVDNPVYFVKLPVGGL